MTLQLIARDLYRFQLEVNRLEKNWQIPRMPDRMP
jgi:hypothetical protein